MKIKLSYKHPDAKPEPIIHEKIIHVDKHIEVEKIIYVDKPVNSVEVQERIVEVAGPKEIVYVDRPVEIEKIVEKEVFIDRPVEVIVEKIIEAAPVTYIKEKIVYKVPPFIWGVLVVESILVFVAFQIMK